MKTKEEILAEMSKEGFGEYPSLYRTLNYMEVLIAMDRYAKETQEELERLQEDMDSLHACYMKARKENMNANNILANLRLLQRRDIRCDDEHILRVSPSDYGNWVLWDDMMYFINGQIGYNLGSGQ